MGLGEYDSLGEYCGLSTVSSVFLILVSVLQSQMLLLCHDLLMNHKGNVCQKLLIQILN